MNFTQFIYIQYLLNRFLVQSLRKPEKNIIPPPEKQIIYTNPEPDSQCKKNST